MHKYKLFNILDRVLNIFEPNNLALTLKLTSFFAQNLNEKGKVNIQIDKNGCMFFTNLAMGGEALTVLL